MATAQPDPPLAADELVAAGTEREVLEAFLAFQRDVLVRKVSGVPELAARDRHVPSKTTLAGLVKHMTGVERGWFQLVLAGRAAAETGPNAGGGADSWELADGETVASLVEHYRRACEVSRQAAARFALDDTVPHRRLGEVSLRWIYVHMIEEYARHNGHADLIRELVDGAVGW